MKKYTQKILKTLPYIAIALIIGVTAVYAAPSINKLTPSGNAITDQMYSLTDIYNLAKDRTPASEKTGEIADTPESVNEAGTGVTLTQVYNAVADALESAGPATLTWQPASDPVVALNLCWNNEVVSENCSVGNGFIQIPDTLITLGAVEYCQYLEADGKTLANTVQNIWHLPTIKEYTSITDYTMYGEETATKVPGFALGSGYWSSTQYAEGTGYSWVWSSWDGGANSSGEVIQFAVRCAR